MPSICRFAFVAIFALVFSLATRTQARPLPDFDSLADSPPTRSAAAAASVQGLVRPGSDVPLHERLGVPTFLWASRNASAAGLAAARAARASTAAASALPLPRSSPLTPEPAAPRHLCT